MSCKDCTGLGLGRGLGYQITVNDSRNLYFPQTFVTGDRPFKRSSCNRIKCKQGGGGKCSQVCQMAPPCGDQFKAYSFRSCDIPLIKSYEEQPWFRNRLVQKDWREFVDQLVTPSNIGAKVCPGPNDWRFKCHRARALIGPSVECVWDLTDQDPCANPSYGYNRDWRRYNEDQRMAASGMKCGGCNDEPICTPVKDTSRDNPPYLGKKFGARYMSWAHPASLMFPRSRAYHFESRRKLC